MAARKLRYSMPLRELLDDIAEFQDGSMIEGLSTDSRMTGPGDLFIAYRGVHVDGRRFIGDAINAGVAAVLAETDERMNQSDYSIPIIQVKNLREHIGVIADRFYQHPSQKMTMVGVTGTNGKSSVTYLVSKALALSGRRSASIGTLGYGVNGELQAGAHTTPDPIALQKTLAAWCNEVDCTVMEVSSHALDQRRVNGIDFDLAVFTNLSRDHMDYHKNLSSYAASKSRLFEFASLQQAVINLDDEFGHTLLGKLGNKVNVLGYTLNKEVYAQNKNHLNIVFARIESMRNLTTVVNIESPWGRDHLHTKLVGKFNIENLLASLSCLCLQGLSLNKAVHMLHEISSVPGRMEQYKKENHALLVVDYAHTPDALEKAQKSLKRGCKGKLITIFGCGGDRDRGKRSEMGAVAEEIADLIVLTNDNPRTEEPVRIIEDILSGIKNKNSAKVILDRSEAITTSFHNSGEQDIILIAGKGHETYQEIQNKRYPFCDRELARRLTE